MNPNLALGVDILEWKKARAFYENHSAKLHEIFTPNERRFIRSASRPHEAFAMIFAAREASFKALGHACRIIPETASRFRVSGHSGLSVTIRKNRRHVVACCQRSA